jgi:hypothetical protein
VITSRNIKHQIKEHEFFVENLKSKTKRVDFKLEAIAQKYQEKQQQQEVTNNRDFHFS